MRFAGAVVVVSVVTVGVVAGFAQAPPRDQSKSIFAPGSALIAGTVVADDEKRAPLRNALVTLVRSGTEDMRSTATDEQGAYEFSAVPAGSYRLVAGKGAYISMDYGAPKPGMPGIPVAISDGQRMAAKPIALIRGAVIAGRLLDANGVPVSGSIVQASQFLSIDGARTARTTSGASGRSATNAHGDYRIHGLLPGDYLVYAQAPTGAPPNQMTADAQRWAENPKGPPPAPARVMGYAPTLFPGTSDPASAVPITLARGEERLGVDLPLQVVPIARISGVVTGFDGQPALNAIIVRTPKHPNTFAPGGAFVPFRTAADGRFVLTGVAPGSYALTVSASSPGPAAVGIESRAGTSSLQFQYGMADVNVAGQDLSNVSIALQPGVSVFGRVAIRGSSPRTWTLSNVRVLVEPTSAIFAQPANSTTHDDGTFRTDGVMPGTHRVRVVIPPLPGSPWAAVSAMHAGRDLLDVPVDVRPGVNLTDVIVTISDVQSTLSGALVDAAGQPAPQLYVFVFSTDRAHWTTGARRIRSVRASDAGRYEIAGLPAGEYFLCALTELDTMVQFQPEYLDQLVAASITITLTDGEKKTQDLRIGR